MKKKSKAREWWIVADTQNFFIPDMFETRKEAESYRKILKSGKSYTPQKYETIKVYEVLSKKRGKK